MAGMGLPSMFDTKIAMDLQLETNAQTAGRLPLGGGMMYASSMKGDLENRNLMNIASMLGGSGNPLLDKQNAVNSVMEKFGKQPETAEDYKTVARMFNDIQQYDFAEKAMAMANKITSEKPARAIQADVNGIKRYVDTGEQVFDGVSKTPVAGKLGTVEIPTEKNGVRYTQRWNTVNGVPTTMLGEQPTDAPGKPTELSLDQLFTDTVEKDPAYKAAVASGNVAEQQKIIATAKRSLALSDDISNQQIQQFTVDSVDEKGNTVYSDVWRSYDKTTNKWVDLESTAQQMKAAVTRTYIDDTDKGKFSITEEWNGKDYIEIARTNVDDIPNSFEQAAVIGVLNSPGYADLDKGQQSELLLAAKQSITIPTTESAINEAYRDIQQDFVGEAQQLASINGDENFETNGRTEGNKAFFEWKNQLAEDVVAAGGNTSISDVLGQYKLWNTISTNSRNGLDQLQNLQNQIADARGTEPGSEQNAASWAVATRTIVSLTKDSNLSLAEVQTVSKAGSVPRKISNYLNQAITGIPVEASIREFEEIAEGLQTVLINRYNTDHSNFNKSFTIAGTDNSLLKSMTGDPIEQVVSVRNSETEDIYDILVNRGLYTLVDGVYYDENGTAIME